ncbi:MAG TPA: N-acetylmuramoyl-L-alanine amidase [Micromonosporaceae bacterium]|jgi:hypothetical protein
MVTRRNLFVGSAATAGLVAVGSRTAASAAVPRQSAPISSARLLAASGFPLPGGVVCPVPYLSRSAWGADESIRFTNAAGYWDTEFHPVQTITVHHTGLDSDLAPVDLVRTIYRNQTLHGSPDPNDDPWGDIGYNLLIDADGVVYEGRYSGSDPHSPDEFPIFDESGQMVTAAHVLHYNSGNIGICMLGWFEVGHDGTPTQAAQDSLVTVLAYLAAVCGVSPTGTVHYRNPVPLDDGTHTTKTIVGVSGHRNWASTDCPGDSLYALLPAIRQRVVAAMASVPKPQPLPTPTPQPTPSPDPSTSDTPTDGGETSASTAPATTTTTKKATATPTPTRRSRSERGGDEGGAVSKKALPSATPKPSVLPTSTVDDVQNTSPPLGLPTWTTPAPAAQVEVADDASGLFGWGIAGTAIGVTAAALGAVGWVVRRRQLVAAQAAATRTPLTVVEQPALVVPDADQAPPPAQADEEQPSTEDELPRRPRHSAPPEE